MKERVVLTHSVVNCFFLLTGMALVALAVVEKAVVDQQPSTSNVGMQLVLEKTPRIPAMINAALVFLTFFVSIAAMANPLRRSWLRAHGWLVVLCGLVTLVLGLVVWVQTLRTRTVLGQRWLTESSPARSLLQQSFNCCGWSDSIARQFETDPICPDSVAAALRPGCVGPVSQFADKILTLTFTLIFGVVGLDMVLLLCTGMVLKQRQEQQRYHLIDTKLGL